MNSSIPLADKQIDTKTKLCIIEEISKLLNERYIFPDVAKSIEKKLHEEHDNGTFEHILSVSHFTKEIDKILQVISKDEHLHLVDNPELLERIIFERDANIEEEERLTQEMINRKRSINFGFKKVEVLDGNVGYLNMIGFDSPSYSYETAISVMNFLANSDAIIFDFRDNEGGDPEMVLLFASCFFEKRILWNMIDRPYRGSIEQYWTLTQEPGGKLVGKDVYILTSNRTFSAGEEFVYGMKYQKKGIIIGEQTRGGAHLCDPFSIKDKLVLIIPTGRSINPITKSNWERVGVEPDIVTSADQAFNVAYEMALKKKMKNEKKGKKRSRKNI